MFCIHLSVNAAMNTGLHVSFQIRVFSRYMPRCGIAVSYFLVFFYGTFMLFPTVAAPIYIPTNNVKRFKIKKTIPSTLHQDI